MIKIVSIALGICLASITGATSQPNVVLLFVDDLGWTDVGVNGSTFYETPNIDALAANGVNFKNSYAANPVCSPTRAAMMSGKAPQRVGITQFIRPRENVHLPLSEFTLGEAFKEAGYQTGYVGKWHLGKEDGVQPGNQGFDWVRATNRGGQPGSYFYPFKKGEGNHSNDVPDLESYKKGDFLTDALTDQALAFIDEKKGAPFFLCVSQYAVHTPIEAPADLVAKYQAKKEQQYGADIAPGIPDRYNTSYSSRQENTAYAALIENLDTNIGRVIDHLKENNLLKNTIILFTSDNGGLAHRKGKLAPTSNLPLRSGKGWTFEGGIRIPTLISWAGKIQPAVSEVPVITMDMYPTLLDLCGLPLKPEQHLDGKSLKHVLAGEADQAFDDRFLAWTYPHTHNNGHRPSAAIQKDDWKLIKFSEGNPFELYHLKGDIGEQHDQSEAFPERVYRLNQLLEQWLQESMPKA